jgi:hypothetical protein
VNWSDPVSFYCERTSATFWAEPVNALTNAGFLMAALAAFLEWRRAGGRDMPVLGLIAVMVLIGLGSFAFHTLATRGAVYFDVIPIAVFIYGYLALALRRFLVLGWLPTIAILVGYIAVSHLLARFAPPGTLNGSIDYLPALTAMLIILGFVPAKIRSAVALAAVTFIVSLTFRTIDQEICYVFPARHAFRLAPAQRDRTVCAVTSRDLVWARGGITYGLPHPGEKHVCKSPISSDRCNALPVDSNAGARRRHQGAAPGSRVHGSLPLRGQRRRSRQYARTAQCQAGYLRRACGDRQLEAIAADATIPDRRRQRCRPSARAGAGLQHAKPGQAAGG